MTQSRLWLLVALPLYLLSARTLNAQTLQPQGRALSPALQPQVVLVLCDGLTANDLENPRHPALFQLAKHGAVALMNVRTPLPHSEASALLTLAAGQTLAARPSDSMAFQRKEPIPSQRGDAATVYFRETGFPPQKPILHLGLASLFRRKLLNTLLSCCLAQHNPPIPTALYGNCDAQQPDRSSALLVIDALGQAEGDVRSSAPNPAAPFGITDRRMDWFYGKLLHSHATLCVLQLGDMARLQQLQKQLGPKAFLNARYQALDRLDVLLFLLWSWMREAPHRDLLLLSPTPAESPHLPGGWQRLTPIVALGEDFPPGLLTSPTTRTPGLVSNTDLAATLLTLFHISAPSDITGRPFHVLPYKDGPHRIAVLARLDYISVLNARAVVGGMVAIGSTGLLFALSALLAHRLGKKRVASWLSVVFVWALTLPAALLLAPLWVPPTLLEYLLRIVAWMVALTFASYVLARAVRLKPPLVASILCLTMVIIDLLTGQNLIKNSLLSGYALSGIRYYGIGNEYLGVLTAMALIGPMMTLDHYSSSRGKMQQEERWPKIVLIALWSFVTVAFGWPFWGANYGSLIVSWVTYGLAVLALWDIRPTPLRALSLGFLGLANAFVFGALDAIWARTASSHAGYVLEETTKGRGFAYLEQIVVRKLLMNVQLLASPYLYLGIGVVAATLLSALLFLPPSTRRGFLQRPYILKALQVLPWGLASALLSKDSGVVCATFMGGTSCVLLLWVALNEEAIEEKTAGEGGMNPKEPSPTA